MATFGIDTSHWQGIYNFEKAKKEGVKYAILKLGGGDSGIYLDSQFNRSYTECKRIGLPVGAYFFGAALTTADAKKEANYVIDQLKGKQFEYPIFYDVEYAPMRNLGKTKLTNIVKAFCGELEKAGYWCGFYTNLDWYRNCLDGAGLAKKYSFWFAYWADAMYNLPDVQMWQKDAHTIAGVNTDSDYCFVDYPTKIKAKGLNGFAKTTATTAKRTPKAGDTVKISYGAYYPNGKRIPDRITSKAWSVRYAGNGKACVYKSGTEILNAEVEVKYLTIV